MHSPTRYAGKVHQVLVVISSRCIRWDQSPHSSLLGAEGNVLCIGKWFRIPWTKTSLYMVCSPQGLNGEGQFCSNVSEMAAKYIKEILRSKIRPERAILLRGYCLGGLIAYEMAQQLREMGKKVELVVMFDTYNGSMIAASTLLLQKPIHSCKFVVSCRKVCDDSSRATEEI